MRLFYLINSWAGRSEWLDASLRFFYVGALPLLATALAAMIFLAPRRRNFSALRVGAAGLGALVLCIGVMAFVPFFQKQFLGGSPISPRPFMTHWVTSLVVEANDNSFPCYEVMLAAATATLLWAILPAYGVAAWGAVFLLAFARTFCGMNYLGDSIAGAVLGASLSTLTLALARVRLQLPSFDGSPHRLTWRVRHQGALSVLAIAGFFVFAFISLSTSPAHSAKFRGLWKNSEASAAPSAIAPPESEAAGSVKVSSAPLPTGIHESEGGVLAAQSAGMVAPGESLLSSPAARLDGHLPQAENQIKAALEELRLPHRIIGVNVAQVKAGNSAFRVAAIRFEIKGKGAVERRRVAETAVKFFKRAFHVDGQIQHIDIIGVNLGGGRLTPSASGLSPTALKAQSIHGGARPAFTASIGRNDLILKNKPAWTNWEKLDPGMWLRARSLLYIDSQILPPAPIAPVVKPVVPQPIVPKLIAPKPAIKKPVVKKPAVKKPASKKPPQTQPTIKRAVKQRPIIKKRATIRRKRVLKKRRYRTRRYRTRR